MLIVLAHQVRGRPLFGDPQIRWFDIVGDPPSSRVSTRRAAVAN